MVDLHSCAGLVNASSALRAMEEEVTVKGQNVKVIIAEISAELQREKQRNAELMERISVLESQMQQKDRESSLPDNNEQESSHAGKRKRQKVEGVGERTENGHVGKSKPVIVMIQKEDSGEEKTQFSYSDSLKDGNWAGDFEDTGNSNDGEGIAIISKKICYSCHGIAGKQENHHDNKLLVANVEADPSWKKEMSEDMDRGNEAISLHKHPCQKRPYKVAFCPKEVEKILESEVLLQKNAQSHTMRKIIAFSSLGIRHGCEDLYELDFNHFKILWKGEPYISRDNPGEHVLYENPGFQQKIFYPNRANLTLCPVQILKEEKAMRPSDSSCPSCLFLCIKYGGSTRNLPQNEYVRQQMGRNKLKSFGTLMCRMALLVNMRSGSFFFKALGITLLFMAGFSDDLVQRETKYRSLDLLRKYYRTNEDAKGEQIFLEHLGASSNASLHCDKTLSKKVQPSKSKTILQTGTSNKIQNAEDDSAKHPPQFGLVAYGSNYQNSAAAVQSGQSRSQVPGKTSPTSVPENPGRISSEHSSALQPMNCFIPMMFWPPPNAYPSFLSGNNYFPAPAFPYCYYGCPPLAPPPRTLDDLPQETVCAKVRDAVASGEADGHSNGSSSSS